MKGQSVKFQNERKKMTILYINACVRENSRTEILAQHLIKKLQKPVQQINLGQIALLPFNLELLQKRNALIKAGALDDPMFSYAHQFANASEIVIAAPMWDLSFPALLKTFIEHINVGGIVFKYSGEGKIVPLCKAKTLYYVTTMGGHHQTDFGFGYIKALCHTLYGIKDVRLIKAEGLNIIGNDVPAILEEAKAQINTMF
ncbi:MAG: NAD(P)H-dependent oxidoreductase [Alphaproteobacteria bacterium]|nr:NAD(P)H-dependent oxidoreductase [Alphaproteobacteria bacterium]